MKLKLWLGSIFLVIGILICGILELFCVLNVLGIKESEPITATIEEIEYSRSSTSDSENHTVFASFINPETGEEEERQLNFYDSSMYEGKVIEVYYNPKTGQILSNTSTLILGILGGVFFVAFGGVGTFLIISYTKQGKKEKRLRLEGKKIYAQITEIGTDYKYQMNNRPAMYFICEVRNEVDGTIQTFMSKRFFSDKILQNHPKMSLIPVYIDYKDKTNYIVDIEGKEERKNII